MRLIILFTLAAATYAQDSMGRLVLCPSTAVGGTGDAITCTPSPAVGAYADGMEVMLDATGANTGAATINISSLGTKSIVKVGGGVTTALAANDIRVNQQVYLRYDGTNFQMLSQLGNAAGATTQERSIFVPVGARNQPASTNLFRCGYDSGVTTGLAASPWVHLSFPDSQDLWGFCQFAMPNDYNGGNVKVQLYLYAAGSAAQTYVARVGVYCIDHGTAFTNSTSTSTSATIATDAGASDVSILQFTGVAATNCSAGEIGWVNFGRVGTDGSDASTLAMNVMAVEVRYVSNQ